MHCPSFESTMAWHVIFMTKSSDQRGENERYINRSLSLDGIGEAGCILKYAEAYTIAPSHIARWLSPGIYCRSWLHTATHSSPLCRRRRAVAQLDQIAKSSQKSYKKFRETDWSYMCLQGFDKFWIWSARYDRKRKLCEFILEKLVKSL